MADAEDDAWLARARQAIDRLSPEERAKILSDSIYSAEPTGRGRFGVLGENGFVDYCDSQREAENSIIIGTGRFDDV